MGKIYNFELELLKKRQKAYIINTFRKLKLGAPCVYMEKFQEISSQEIEDNKIPNYDNCVNKKSTYICFKNCLKCCLFSFYYFFVLDETIDVSAEDYLYETRGQTFKESIMDFL